MQKHAVFSRAALGLTFATTLTLTLTPFAAAAAPNNAPQKTLKAFASDDDLFAFLKRVRPNLPERRFRPGEPVPMAAPPPPPPAPASADASSAGPQSESITSTQEANVDEGGIVKNYGDYLVILRRGRLFTVSTAGGGLRPVASINAFPPDVNGRGDWYDEMLISGNRVIVIGYSYARGGTEVNRFRIDAQGGLTFEDAYHLRSNDYYSSRNYASRLIGQRLIVYTPLYLPYRWADGTDRSWMPAFRRWTGKTDEAAFKPMLSGRQIFTPPHWDKPGRDDVGALHTVMNCDLAAAEMDCKAIGILGPRSRNFYVSANAVYVWVSGLSRQEGREEGPTSLLYRLPLDGGLPSAAGVHGAPTDQFSFREDWNDGRINVLVRSEGGGDAMWQPEFKSGNVALLQLPLADFGDGSTDTPKEFYRALPAPSSESYGFQNRFVGNYVLYGTGTGWGQPTDRSSKLVVAAVRGSSVTELLVRHGIDRIEAMGQDAVAIGADSKDLNFQAVELTDGWRPKFGDLYALKGASQGETRSHAFFFKPAPTANDEAAGLLGLPIARAGRPGYKQLAENSAAILFLRRSDRLFAPLGELGANEEGVKDDGCQASCVDWYGNARPIFMKGRIFALMGYELVEGSLRRNSIREIRRVSFAPAAR